MTLMFVSFLIGILAKVPVALMLLISSLFYIISKDLPMTVVVQQLTNSVSGYTLVAVPLYILAGEIMNTGGITKRLFALAMAMGGHIRGGLAHVNVIASMIFAGISGSSSADAAGLGRIEIQAMIDEGYDVDFSATITAISSIIGPIIPPSIHLVLYSSITEVSVSKLFAGGLIPGIIVGLTLMLFIYFRAVTGKEKCPTRKRETLSGIWKAAKFAFFPMMAPVLILSGILFGIVTATEAAALAVVYCVILALFYKELKWKDIPRILKNTISSTGVVMLILATGQIFAWIITLERLPELLVQFVYSFTQNRYLIILLINIVLLIIGCFLPATSGLLIVTPIAMKVAQQLGIDFVHLGVWLVLGLIIGVVTPPVGASLYIVSDIAKVPMEKLIKKSLPYYIPLLVALLLVSYFPALTTTLPNLIGGK